GRFVGDPGATNSGAVPIHHNVGRFALPIPNERQLKVIRGRGARDETGLAFRKDFAAIITRQAADMGNKMISQFIILMRDTKCWTEADQSENERLPVLAHIAVV